jgi:hypothetical protein
MKSTFQKLAEKIKKDLDFDAFDFRREYVGYWQRSNGAWVWSAKTKNGPITIGSQWSATYLLKAKKLAWADMAKAICPED